jgi:hypothetical protein
MEKKSYLHFSNYEKHYALLVFLGVASIHFLITAVMSPWADDGFGLKSLVYLVLMMPSFVLGFIVYAVRSVELPFSGTLSLQLILMIIFSSSFNGIIGGFLASKKKALRWISIILIGLSVLLDCFIWGLSTVTGWQ